MSPQELIKLNSEAFLEMITDISQHIRLSRCSEATNGGQGLIACVLANEARGVHVIWTEIVAPLRQAVGLIENPSADLALAYRTPESLVAELLRRYQQNADIAHLDLLQHISTLRHGQQAIERRSTLHISLKKPVNLILHQRLQRRNDDGQAAVAMKTIQRRQLVTQRFTTTGCQDSEHMSALHACENHIVLQALAGAFVAEISKAEVALQLMARIVGRAAVAAV